MIFFLDVSHRKLYFWNKTGKFILFEKNQEFLKISIAFLQLTESLPFLPSLRGIVVAVSEPADVALPLGEALDSLASFASFDSSFFGAALSNIVQIGNKLFHIPFSTEFPNVMYANFLLSRKKVSLTYRAPILIPNLLVYGFYKKSYTIIKQIPLLFR